LELEGQMPDAATVVAITARAIGLAMLLVVPAVQSADHRAAVAPAPMTRATADLPSADLSAHLPSGVAGLTTAVPRSTGVRPISATSVLPTPREPASPSPIAVPTTTPIALAPPVTREPPTGPLPSSAQARAEPAPPPSPARDQSRALPITRLEIPSIGLVSAVVPAPLIQIEGGRTWQVPAFKVGHAQYSAGAGQVGNAVLLGHVASLHAGSVFRDLHRARRGDLVRVFSGTQRFDYRVVQTRIVLPDDLSVLRPTGTASVILITCAGEWIPRLDDFSQRLIVRADLVTPRP
jgi:LPXTG-site transpeptidase (sortase) family protein